MNLFVVELCYAVVDDDKNIETWSYTGESFYTTNLLEAVKVLKEKSEDLETNDLVTLSLYDLPIQEPISMNEEEFEQNYNGILVGSTSEELAMINNVDLSDSGENYFDSLLDKVEILEGFVRLKAKYFNMRVICEEAGINYSTYRGFKNNKRYFSEEKLIDILKTMQKVGDNCWDDNITDAIKTLNS